MKRGFFLLMAFLVGLTSCCCPSGSRRTTAATPTPRRGAPTATAGRTPQPTITRKPWSGGWETYSGKGVTVKLPNDLLVLPVPDDEWLFKAMCSFNDGTAYWVHVGNLGTKLGSSIADLKQRARAPANMTVIDTREGKVEGREYYRLEYLPNPVKEDSSRSVVYYFFVRKNLIAVQFTQPLVTLSPVQDDAAHWPQIVARIEIE